MFYNSWWLLGINQTALTPSRITLQLSKVLCFVLQVRRRGATHHLDTQISFRSHCQLLRWWKTSYLLKHEVKIQINQSVNGYGENNFKFMTCKGRTCTKKCWHECMGFLLCQFRFYRTLSFIGATCKLVFCPNSANY